MTSLHPKSLDDILAAADTLPPEEQLHFVKRACAGDDALYQAVVDRLDSRVAWSDSWEEDGGDGDWSRATDPAGEIIGPYRVVRSLGQGGMGEVFLAERADEQFQQRVAIKLVKRGLLSRQIQSRLRLERQILANLDHPNIARLLDGGTTTEGTPYIVMEYVDGQPIDTYCDSRALSVRQRLALFRTVCSAVHSAHQNLIVHRDLKPSNILVTAEGMPKLLDFGIAKILDARQMAHTVAVTQADFRLMTPDHASPEQVSGDPITTASDIYVLGVLLYELLTGFKPFVLKGNRLADLERAICEDIPTAPSEAFSPRHIAAQEELEKIAAQRSSTVSKLRRELHADLDNIVLMALRKEPERRYSSVQQFSEDIERYLQGQTVQARIDTWTYRTGKFIKRHALIVTLCAALLALLVGFTVNTFVQSTRIAQERDIAEAQRRDAQLERERAQHVSSFLIDLFETSDPEEARGRKLTANDILDRGAKQILADTGGQPELQGVLLNTIGEVYLKLRNYAAAKPLMERALDIFRRNGAMRSTMAAGSLLNLTEVLIHEGDLNGAETLARQSMAISEQVAGAHSLGVARGECGLGIIQMRRENLAAAEQLFQSCLASYETSSGVSDSEMTMPLENLARILAVRGDYAGSEQLYRRVLGINIKLGEDHPRYIQQLHNLATVLQRSGQLVEAEKLYRQAYAMTQRVYGEGDSTTADVLANLGSLLQDKGDLDGAQQAYQSALVIYRKAWGEQHSDTAYALGRLAGLALQRNDYARAEQLYRQALAIYEAILQPGSGYIASAQLGLARTLVEAGQPAAAQTLLNRAIPVWESVVGKRSPQYALSVATLGRALALQGHAADAEPLLIEGYRTLAQLPGARHEDVQKIRRWVEEVAHRLGHEPPIDPGKA